MSASKNCHECSESKS